MLRYYITDRKQLGGLEGLLRNIERQILAGVDWIQIREKDLSTRELLALSRRTVALASSSKTLVFINSRMDVALAACAHGVHLPSHSAAPSEFKRCCAQVRVGVSCHDLEELERADTEGADYAVLGPVFDPISKSAAGSALGLERFRELASAVKIPVLALGGITEENIPGCRGAGAAGVAGISLFQAGA